MLSFFVADQNILFAVILTIVGIFFLMEVLGLLVAGFDLAGLLDGIFPEIDIDINVDSGLLSKVLGWVGYKEVPLILVLFVLMGSVSIIGYIIQYICLQISSHLLPWYIPTLISLVPSFYIAKTFASVMGKLLTQEDKWVLKEGDLIGKFGVITTGTARADLPAEAKVEGPNGKHHYIRVIPHRSGISLPEKTKIITVSLDKGRYRVIEDEDSMAT